MATVPQSFTLLTREWTVADQAGVHLRNRENLARRYNVPVASVSAGTAATLAASAGRDPGVESKSYKGSTVLSYTVTVP